jgi:PhnB protein
MPSNSAFNPLTPPVHEKDRPMLLTPYLGFDGNCAEAFKFYEQTLGGKILMLMTWGDTPMAAQFPPEQHKMVAHARLSVGETLLMGGDKSGDCGGQAMQGFSVNITLTDAKEADRIFGLLADGGTITMPIAETFWAERFGMVTDRFGTPWMINCERPMPAS